MVKRKQVTFNDVPYKTTPKTPAERKAIQRDKIRAWILKQTNGKITTSDGYVMWLMKQDV